LGQIGGWKKKIPGKKKPFPQREGRGNKMPAVTGTIGSLFEKAGGNAWVLFAPDFLGRDRKETRMKGAWRVTQKVRAWQKSALRLHRMRISNAPERGRTLKKEEQRKGKRFRQRERNRRNNLPQRVSFLMEGKKKAKERTGS